VAGAVYVEPEPRLVQRRRRGRCGGVVEAPLFRGGLVRARGARARGREGRGAPDGAEAAVQLLARRARMQERKQRARRLVDEAEVRSGRRGCRDDAQRDSGVGRATRAGGRRRRPFGAKEVRA